MISRRQMILSSAIASGALALKGPNALADDMKDMPGIDGMDGMSSTTKPAAQSGAVEETTTPSPTTEPTATGYRPVITPNNSALPWKLVGGVKVFHLIAEEINHEFAPGLVALCWGFNGNVHGPTIEAVQGDRVRIFVTNRLPTQTAIHWHGLILPNGMDGVSGLNQRPIESGETVVYEFDLVNAGTHMYHSHHDEMTQIGLGLTGLFIIHSKKEERPVDRDFAIMLHEWRIDAGARRPNPNEMTEFNVLTMNGKCYPATDPLVVKKGERVRIRLANLGPMDHHPIHLHGYTFKCTATDGGPIPESAQWPLVTMLVPVGETRDIEFTADNPGDWSFHCHMTHHAMNQMGHGGPNMIGVNPQQTNAAVRPVLKGYMTMGTEGMGEMGEMQMAVPPNSIPMMGAAGKYGYITMGGMFTIVKVRDGLTSYADPGWYEQPTDTSIRQASAGELRDLGLPARSPLPNDPAHPPEHDEMKGMKM